MNYYEFLGIIANSYQFIGIPRTSYYFQLNPYYFSYYFQLNPLNDALFWPSPLFLEALKAELGSLRVWDQMLVLRIPKNYWEFRLIPMNSYDFWRNLGNSLELR